MAKRGRKPKYSKELVKKAREFAAQGLGDYEIARALGIHPCTFFEYEKTYSNFSDAIKKGQEESIDKVENALFKRALGFEYIEKKEETYGDKIKITETEKRALGDTTAQIFILKNRRPDSWKDRRDIEHSGQIAHPEISAISELTKEELLEIVRQEDQADQDAAGAREIAQDEKE